MELTRDHAGESGRVKALLACGIGAPLLYALADLVAGMLWEGYSFRDQTISELGAVSAPSRPVFSALLFIVYALMLGFSVGIWKSAGGARGLRAVGSLLAAVSVLALTVGQFAAMRPRGDEQGLAGAMHLLEGLAAMILIFTAMAMAATAFGRRFRLYTIATVAVAVGFGVWAALDAPRVEQGVATPWVGVKERIFWYGYQSWYIVLALTLLRGRRTTTLLGGAVGARGGQGDRGAKRQLDVH